MTTEGFGTCLKYCTFVFNLIFFLAGGALVGVGIWMAVDRNFLTSIIGTALYTVVCVVIIACGAISLFIAFFGCCGAINENRCMLMTYFVFLLVILILLLVGGILAVVFRTTLTNSMQSAMDDSLKNRYGYNLNEELNQAITQGWDMAQDRLQCCAIANKGWKIYRQTNWYKYWPDQNNKPWVPESCCTKDAQFRYLNTKICQFGTGMPPATETGAKNDYLHYTGCYEAGINFLYQHAYIMIGLGFGVIFLLIVGMIFSMCLYRNLD
ncbi:unnamed protein product [Owenia fusiformis]|uniref:Uncharacterized protein n=1 Tax=Owenia fusiformis TaxID=6347 RepID=A0A8J1XUE0_OWEFU|nr:unnamed protein product [Owenia fusiformis]